MFAELNEPKVIPIRLIKLSILRQ